MSKYIVDIHGEIEGDYEIIKKYEEPTTKSNLGVDCISRQAVEDAMYDATRAMDLNYGQIMEYIDNLPSVTPQARKGHWKHNKCDVCGASRPPLFDNYCPNCGCRMVEPQESEE